MKLSHRLAPAFAVIGLWSIAAAPAAADPRDGLSIQAEALGNVEGESFVIKVVDANVKTGAEGVIQVSIQAKDGFKVNDEYPHKLTFADPPAGVSLPKPTLKKADGKFEGKSKFTFAAPVVAASAGRHALTATVKFSVCNESQCQIKSADVTATVNAK